MSEMTNTNLPRIIVVDDEEAILETMSFTFMDDYEVLTTTDAPEALQMLEEHSPVHVVITDQRMPGMTGVQLLKEVYDRFPDTVRIMLTGFADSEATIQAINDGHIYAYINKPWEPDDLKRVVRRAVEHFDLACENRRLVDDLRSANSIMQAVMDRLETGAVAIDRDGIVQAANKPALAVLNIDGDPRGRNIETMLADCGMSELGEMVRKLEDDHGGGFEDLDLRVEGKGHQIRISSQQLVGEEDESLGRVILFKEISHEPLRRRFEELVASLVQDGDGLRDRLEVALKQLVELGGSVRTSGVNSTGMSTLSERVSRSQTAIQNWLDVDEELATVDFPDAQLLIDRMRVATQRWPQPDDLPRQVGELAGRVEAYYESGENSRQRVL